MKFTGKIIQWAFGGIGAALVVLILEQSFCSKNEEPQTPTQSIINQQNQADKIENNQTKEINVHGDYVEGDKYEYAKENEKKIQRSIQVQVPRLLLLPDSGQLNLHNQGNSDIYLWGTRFNNGQKLIDSIPRVIPAGAFYYFLTDKIHVGSENVEDLVPFEVYVSDKFNHKFTGNFILFISKSNGSVKFHTQQMGVEKRNWEKS